MKLQSLKMFKTTKDMFYKQFDFFCDLTGPIMRLRVRCPLVSTGSMVSEEEMLENDGRGSSPMSIRLGWAKYKAINH